MLPYHIDFNNIPWQTCMKGVRFKVAQVADRQLRLVEYTSETEAHWCEKGHIGYVLEGRFEIRFPGEDHIYNEGDGIFIPAGAEHKHMGRAVTDIVRVVFVEDVEA